MNTDKLVGDIVTHWQRLGEGRKTVIFAVDVNHSVHIAAEFNAAGIPAGHIDGTTPVAEREETLRKLSAGELTVVSNCMVLTEGWDQPDVSCAVLARPTKSLGLNMQMVGRVLRTHPGKANALILDHAGNLLRHGLPEDEIAWTLDADDRAENKSLKAREKAKANGETPMCVPCSPMQVPLVHGCCRVCGWMPKRKGEAVEFADGDLARLGAGRKSNPREWSQTDKDRFFAELIWYAGEHQYKRGWAAHKFQERFGDWPPYGFTPKPVQPSPETISWIRSRQIAWAKSRRAA
jgi:superfamily II DNA or RNA helicase